MGTTFLPQNRFLGNCGQKGDHFFTPKSFFWQLRAKRRPLFYRKIVIGAIAGKKGTTFLPQNCFLGNCGQKGYHFFTNKIDFWTLTGKMEAVQKLNNMTF
jgi:hypothetical protein